MIKFFTITLIFICLSISSAKASVIEYINQDSVDYSVGISTNYLLIDSSDLFIHIGDTLYKSPTIVNTKNLKFDGTYKWSLYFDLVGSEITVKPLLGKLNFSIDSPIIHWSENPYLIKNEFLFFDVLKYKSDNVVIIAPRNDIPSVPLPGAIWMMLVGMVAILRFSNKK